MQPQLISVLAGDRDLLAALKPERLLEVEVLAHAGEVEALAVQRHALVEDAGDPVGETADSGEVKQELRGGKTTFQRHVDEVEVGDAVARNAEQHVHRVAQQLDFGIAVDKGLLELEHAVIDALQPRLQAEDADVLGQLHRLGFVLEIPQLVEKFGLLVAVLVAPLVGALGHQEADQGGRQHHRQQHRVEVLHQQQVEDKARDVCQEVCQRRPDVLARHAVLLHRTVGLVAQVQHSGVQRVGEGGGVGLVADLVKKSGAHLDAPEDGILVDIGLQPQHQKQRQRKDADGAEQLRQRRLLLDPREDLRRDKKLHQIDPDGQSGGQHAHPKHALAGAPGVADHPADVLENIVMLFACLFHLLFPLFLVSA